MLYAKNFYCLLFIVLITQSLNAVDRLPLSVGQTVVKKFDIDPMNRYAWSATGYSHDILEVTDQGQEGSKVLFQVHAKKSGRTNLRFEFRMKGSQQAPSQSIEYFVAVS